MTVSIAMFGAMVAQVAAHEEPFGYVRGSQTEPKGELELEQWTTGRIVKEGGRYLGLDFNTELEHGVTDRFQVAGHVNINYHCLDGADSTWIPRNAWSSGCGSRGSSKVRRRTI